MKLIKCRLSDYFVKYSSYKGDPYMRGYLTFEIKLLGIIKYKKKIIYDVTMFEDWVVYDNHWRGMIHNKNIVDYSIIKNRKIF